MHDLSAEQWIRERSRVANRTTEAPIDVGDRVMTTLADYDRVVLTVDKTPLLVGGGLLALAASVTLVLLPSLTTMTEPWISFWLL